VLEEAATCPPNSSRRVNNIIVSSIPNVALAAPAKPIEDSIPGIGQDRELRPRDHRLPSCRIVDGVTRDPRCRRPGCRGLEFRPPRSPEGLLTAERGRQSSPWPFASPPRFSPPAAPLARPAVGENMLKSAPAASSLLLHKSHVWPTSLPRILLLLHVTRIFTDSP
jgi:hypothetical protein